MILIWFYKSSHSFLLSVPENFIPSVVLSIFLKILPKFLEKNATIYTNLVSLNLS